MPVSNYDHLFGGKPGAALKARSQMRKTYGPDKGEKVFWGTVHKRELRAKRRKERKR